MGITAASLKRIEKHGIKPPGKLLIVGCQNLYNPENYGQVAHGYFESLGFTVRSWDITGCQGSEVVDLREPQPTDYKFDYIFQHGTVEHMDGWLYQGFKNLHDLGEVGCVYIHENPKTGNWPSHGYHYFTKAFYEILCAFQEGYELLELEEEAAMGNVTDGWNICAVIKKTSDSRFVSQDLFNTLDIRKS